MSFLATQIFVSSCNRVTKPQLTPPCSVMSCLAALTQINLYTSLHYLALHCTVLSVSKHCIELTVFVIVVVNTFRTLHCIVCIQTPTPSCFPYFPCKIISNFEHWNYHFLYFSSAPCWPLPDWLTTLPFTSTSFWAKEKVAYFRYKSTLATRLDLLTWFQKLIET